MHLDGVTMLWTTQVISIMLLKFFTGEQIRHVHNTEYLFVTKIVVRQLLLGPPLIS